MPFCIRCPDCGSRSDTKARSARRWRWPRVLVPLACMLPVAPVERVLLITSVLLVLIVELLNSSVEAAIDRIGLDTHRLSKRAKDLGSAAVLLTLVALTVVWALLAVPALMQIPATHEWPPGGDENVLVRTAIRVVSCHSRIAHAVKATDATTSPPRIAQGGCCVRAPPRRAHRRTRGLLHDAGRGSARAAARAQACHRESGSHRPGPAHGRVAPSGRIPSVHAGEARHAGAGRRGGRRLHVAADGARGRADRHGVGAAGATGRGDDQASGRPSAGQLRRRAAPVRRSGARAGAEARPGHARPQLSRHHVPSGRPREDELSGCSPR